jgi:hypothetical protein
MEHHRQSPHERIDQLEAAVQNLEDRLAAQAYAAALFRDLLAVAANPGEARKRMAALERERVKIEGAQRKLDQDRAKLGEEHERAVRILGNRIARQEAA